MSFHDVHVREDAADGAYFFARGGGRVVASHARRASAGVDGDDVAMLENGERGDARKGRVARPFHLAEKRVRVAV